MSRAGAVRLALVSAAVFFTLVVGRGITTVAAQSSDSLTVGAADAAIDLANAYFISPSGSDSNDGRSQAKPFRSFAKAFSAMPGGNTLVLLDGTYSEAAGTGYISYLGTGSGQPASGTASSPTQVVALNPGQVTITGHLFIGRSARKDSYIRIQGITFQGGGDLYNTSYITVKECGFHGAFGIGTNDHDQGNTRNLIEDVWVWAAGERLIASNYRAHENVWRRVVVRGDGCGTAECSGDGNPNVGITVYDSRDVSLQNVIVLDRVLTGSDGPYADFAVAQHATDSQYYLGRNEWLGTISIAAPDAGYYFEPDAVINPTIKIQDAVAWDSASDAFNLARAGTLTLQNLTAKARGGDGVRVAPGLTGSLSNVLVAGATHYGINSAITPSYADVWSASTAYNQTSCSTGCYTQDPIGNGSLKYVTRIEPGSFLKGKGAGGGDIGANVVNRYGTDGTRFGDAGYDSLTASSLWPWPNEARIKREMCDQSGVSRGFCSAASLTDYIWGYLGNASPVATSPQLSVSDVSVNEGNSGTVNANFVVSLSPASTGIVTVNYATANGTATAGSDYTAVSGTLTFSPGETSKVVAVPVIGDVLAESNETFYLALSGASGAPIVDSQGVGTIVNDDSVTPPRPQRVWQDWFAVDKLETPMVGDFNGDRKTDIITFTRQNPLAVGDVYVALSNGAQFGPNVKWSDWFAISSDETVVIGDFNGDGKDDIATWLGKTSRQVYVALSTGSGMKTSAVWSSSIGFDPSDVILSGDVNGDGKKDLVCFARKQGKAYVALSTGTSFKTPTVWHNFFAVSTYERPRVADVNGDGKADIVTFATDSPSAYGDVYVALSDGTKFVDQGGIPNSSTKWHDWFAIDPKQEIRVGDINGDAKADFFTFLPLPWGQAYTVTSQGKGLGPNVQWPEQLEYATTDVPFVGDVNGDGKADIIVFAQGEGKVYVSLGR